MAMVSPSLPVFLFVALMTLAACTDVLSFRIPNWLTILVAVLFFPIAFYTGMSWQEVGLHIAAGIILFFVGFAFFSLRFIGGGDAKLIAAAALWFGTAGTGPFLYAAVMAGGVMAGAMAFWSLGKYIIQLDFNDFMPSIRKLQPQMPYGVPLAAGAIIALPYNEWLMSTL